MQMILFLKFVEKSECNIFRSGINLTFGLLLTCLLLGLKSFSDSD